MNSTNRNMKNHHHKKQNKTKNAETSSLLSLDIWGLQENGK